jgi:hypothetical protein
MGCGGGEAEPVVIQVPVRLIVQRRLVRQHPWLLSDQGTARRALIVTLGPLELEIQSEAALTRQKTRLQTEAAPDCLTAPKVDP